MKGDLALDMIVKFLIILVVAGVVIGLFMMFSSDSKDAVKNMFAPNNTKETGFPKTIQQNSFSSGEVANYIDSCYSKMSAIPATQQKDITCYVLMANSAFSNFVTSSAITGALSADARPRTSFNTTFGRDYLKINFIDIGDRIIVS
jgi:hypothetical protein